MIIPRFEHSKAHEEAIALFEKGLGYKAVSTILQVNRNTVRNWARNWRIGIHYHAEATPEDKAKALAMRASGASLMEIVAELKMSKRRIMTWLSYAKASADEKEAA